jgi:hypothetical protein
MKDDDWDEVLTRTSGRVPDDLAVAKSMMRQKSGRIINIASTAGAMGNPGQVNYRRPRRASSAHEGGARLAHWNILVNAVALWPHRDGHGRRDSGGGAGGPAPAGAAQGRRATGGGGGGTLPAGDGATYVTGQTSRERWPVHSTAPLEAQHRGRRCIGGVSSIHAEAGGVHGKAGRGAGQGDPVEQLGVEEDEVNPNAKFIEDLG